MSYINLYTACVDWFTVTSFEKEFDRFWENRLRAITGNKSEDGVKVQQYTGSTFDLERGTAYLGTAFQKGTIHYMLRLTGGAAEDNKNEVFSQLRQRFVECTRIDLQVTVPMPKKWNQFALLTRMEEKGRLTGYKQSKDREGRFQTVYIGSRESNRMTRVYMKKSGETMLLRLETEYKKPRSNAIARMLADGNATPSRYLMYELQKTLADKELSVLFEPSLSGAKPLTERLKVASSTEKTEKWLLEQVYASFQRHINDHDASGRVLAAFYSACKEAIEQDDNG